MANESLQDLFLNELRRERQLATVFLMNGFQMKGVVPARPVRLSSTL